MKALRWLKMHWPAIVLPTAIGLALLQAYYPKTRGLHRDMLGTGAPTFSAPALGGSGLGATVDLQALRGRVVVLDFWASWCAPCKRAATILNDLQEQFGDDVVFVGVNLDSRSEPDEILAAHRKFGYAFPTVHDGDSQIRKDFRVVNLPTLVLLTRKGDVAHVEEGVPVADALEAKLRNLL